MVDIEGLTPCTFNISLVPGKHSALSNQAFRSSLTQEISRIFGLAGLGVDFTATNPDFTLVIANTVAGSLNINANAVGATPVEAGQVLARGTVFQSRLETSDSGAAQSYSLLGIGLARAGTHEAGHYFLQMKGHSQSGVMSPAFSGSAWHSPDPEGAKFGFTSSQAAALQKACSQMHPGNGSGGGSPGIGGGLIFESFYGEEGNFIGGAWVPAGHFPPPRPSPL